MANFNIGNVIGDTGYLEWIITNFKGFATNLTGKLNPTTTDLTEIGASKVYTIFNDFLTTLIEMNTSVINSSKISNDSIIAYANNNILYPDTIADGTYNTDNTYRNMIYRVTPTFASNFDSHFTASKSKEYYKLWQKYLNNTLALNSAIVLTKKWDEGSIPINDD